MTSRSPLFGRRVHLSGSIATDVRVASADKVKRTRELVAGLTRELIALGATFVLPVDDEKVRDGDRLPVCFDWLIWQTLHDNLVRRPAGAVHPLAVAVEHHKTEEQIPKQFHKLWDDLRSSDLIQIENASHWNMNSRRLEAQARWGDILVTIGGSEGALFLANLYHDAGKPVVPLNAEVTGAELGARRLFSAGLSSARAERLFQPTSQSAHSWMNRINFATRTPVADQVKGIVQLLEALERPRAFVVRLLNPEIPDYADVQQFFDVVAQPVIENELGYRMVVVDGRQKYQHSRIDEEIFAKLHRSRVVFADLTSARPNCFLELGYALGRGLPTMVMAKEGSSTPFDIHTFAGLYWKTTGSVDDRRRAFREHWTAIQTRPPLVPVEPLVP